MNSAMAGGKADRLLLTAGRWRGAAIMALAALSMTSWLAVALARTGSFALWPLATLPLSAAAAAGLLAWWRLAWADRLAIALCVAAGALLYTPPAEMLPLFGDAAIYPNAGAFIARTGAMGGQYAPLAAVAPEARELFYVSSAEQLPRIAINSYRGIVYGAYYLTDLAALQLQTSRPPLVEALFGLAVHMVGVRLALYGTALFGILSLTALYWLSRHYLPPLPSLWVVALLAVSYPQIYVGRAAYGEIFGQFWLLVGLACAVLWVKEHSPGALTAALFCWVTAWAARFDALFCLIPLAFLLCLAVLRRDGRSVWFLVWALPPLAALAVLGTNLPYVGATWEIVAGRWFWFVPLALLLLCATGIVLSLLYVWGQRLLPPAARLGRALRLPLLGLLVMVLIWATVPTPLRVADAGLPFQEQIWYSSQYVTVGLYWLALVGIGRLLWRQTSSAHLFLVATFLGLALILFYRYTTAPVYPVSLRRLIGSVLPLLALLAGLGLWVAPPSRGWATGQRLVAAGALIWMLALSWPLLGQREGVGSVAFVAELHAALPADGALLFEPQDEDSWVGWLAAPLYSLYGDWTLLLNSDTPPPAALATAVASLEAAGRRVYLVSQHQPLPVALTPPGYRAVLWSASRWRSTLIGQTRLPYPPPYWHFEHPVHLYQLQRVP